MKHLIPFILCSHFSAITFAAELPRPRGVGPQFAKFYKSENTFTCISNPSITIKTSQINDDFCDCPDGSDEPGTAACTLISAPSVLQLPLTTSHNSTPALAGFYCKNKGHFPAFLPHTHVNDGVCDSETCCDGSDEWASVGGVKCEDKCKEIGQEWMRLDEIKQNSLRAALKKRSELVAAAQILRTNVEKDIAKLKQEVKELEEKTKETKSKYEELQQLERRRLVSTAGKKSDVSELVSLAKKRINEIRHALIVVVSRRDTLQSRVQELELILSTFKDEYNPNFNDEGVKRAVKAWEDYEAAKNPDQVEAEILEAEDKELAEALTEDGKDYGIDWEKWNAEKNDAGSEVESTQLLPSFIHNWLRDRILDFHVMLVENGVLPGKSSIDSESKIVTEARELFQSVSDDLQVKLTTLGRYQADLENDYGVDGIFRALKGQCIEKDSGEYIYELCWLEGAKQKSKKGGGSTGMGQFVRFDQIDIDEEIRPDGKGLGTGKHLSLRYENGNNCWNGPSRETTVVLGCAEENEIWRITELEKCIYRMDVGTPAVCETSKANKKVTVL
ncbi:hypothetical protein K3495_g671 [Podosphaera aphanis]|nr:hypothetical protein K3495_g671 [Podosphaera aphanis]